MKRKEHKRTSSKGRKTRKVSVRPPRSWIFVAGVLSLLLFSYLSYGLICNYRELQQINAEINEVHEEIEQERLAQDKLQDRIELLEDPQYIEMKAREQLGLIRPGDVPIKWGHSPGN